MRRFFVWLVLILPFCLLAQDRNYGLEERSDGRAKPASSPGEIEHVSKSVSKHERIEGLALVRQQSLAVLAAAPTGGVPGAVPWGSLHSSATEGLRYVMENHTLHFLQMALDRYDAEIEGYTCILRKNERINGKVQPTERVECKFLEKPFSVWMKWLEGARTCSATLWVQGKNDNLMWARGAGIFKFAVVQRAIDSGDAKLTSRYSIDEFGIRWGTLRAQRSLHEALKGKLEMRYLGEETVPEVGGRLCHKFHFKYDPPDEFGLADLTLYFDVTNWLQVGSVLKLEDGNLLAEYFFRDVIINPKFAPNQFEKGAI